MAKKIRWNLAAFEEIRRLPAMDKALQDEVDATLAALPDGDYAGGVEPGRTRSRGFIVTKGVQGIRTESRHHYLSRRLGGGV